MKRVLLRGGSVPSGRNVAVSCSDILKYELEKAGISFISVARNGDSTFEGMWNFDRDVLPFRPDFLILYFGVDDAFRPVYRSEYKENLVQIIRRARKELDASVAIVTSHLFAGEYEMNALSIYNRVVREVTADLDCMYIPVHMHWLNYLVETGKKIEDLITDDPRYPNELGHRLIAQSILHKIFPDSDAIFG